MAKVDMPETQNAPAQKLKPTTKPATTKPKGQVRKRTFEDEAGDFFADVGEWMWYDNILPAFFDLLSDILTGSMDRVSDAIIPREYRRGHHSYGSRRDYWSGYYDDEDYYGRRRRRRRSSSAWDDDDDDYYGSRKRKKRRRSDDFDMVEFKSRQDRDVVLDRIQAALRKNGQVSIQKIKIWSGCEEDVVRTDIKWGYTDMRDMSKGKSHGYYTIEFDEPELLDDY